MAEKTPEQLLADATKTIDKLTGERDKLAAQSKAIDDFLGEDRGTDNQSAAVKRVIDGLKTQAAERASFQTSIGDSIRLPAMTAPMVGRTEGEKLPSEDRRYGDLSDGSQWIHVEEFNFRNDARYDDNWLLRAESALKAALKQDFGQLDGAGFRSFGLLPPFAATNRLIVVVAVQTAEVASGQVSP